MCNARSKGSNTDYHQHQQPKPMQVQAHHKKCVAKEGVAGLQMINVFANNLTEQEKVLQKYGETPYV